MLKRHLLLTACFSLITGTAAASIPDASGVYHACYNRLTGSVKLIDGTSCGLLERHVTWQEQGIAGPQGPAGQSVTSAPLAVGDARCPTGGVALTLAGNTTYVCNGAKGDQGPAPKVSYGSETIVPAFRLDREYTEAYTQPFTALGDGKCFVTIDFVMGFRDDIWHPRDYENPPPAAPPYGEFPEFTVRSVIKEDEYGTNVSARKAVMTGPSDRKSATVHDVIDVVAGSVYRFGGSYTGATFTTFVPAERHNYANVDWHCIYY